MSTTASRLPSLSKCGRILGLSRHACSAQNAAGPTNTTKPIILQRTSVAQQRRQLASTPAALRAYTDKKQKRRVQMSKLPFKPDINPLYEFTPEEKLPGPQLDDLEKATLCTLRAKDINPVILDAFPKQFKGVAEAIADHTYLVREPMQKVEAHLAEQTASKELSLSKFFFWGKPGSGLSMGVAHCMHYCHQNNWLVIHHPTDGRFHHARFVDKPDVQRNSFKKDIERYDSSKEAMQWLREFEEINVNLLEQIETTQTYTFSQLHQVTKGSTLSDVVKMGLYRGSYASDAVGIILKEIAAQKKLKVLYAVDAINALYTKSFLKHEGRVVPLEQLSLIRHFSKLLLPEHTIQQGCILAAMSSKVFGCVTSYKTRPHPKIILTSHLHKKQFSNYQHLEFGEYSEQEYNTVMKYYKQQEWVQRNLTPALMTELSFYTQKNPGAVLHYLRCL